MCHGKSGATSECATLGANVAESLRASLEQFVAASAASVNLAA